MPQNNTLKNGLDGTFLCYIYLTTCTKHFQSCRDETTGAFFIKDE